MPRIISWFNCTEFRPTVPESQLAVRLKALGIPSVTVEGRAARGLLSKPLSFGLLVYLGLEGEVTRDALLGLFWPERAADRARHALSQALYDLRKDLGVSWADTEGDLIRTYECGPQGPSEPYDVMIGTAATIEDQNWVRCAFAASGVSECIVPPLPEIPVYEQ